MAVTEVYRAVRAYSRAVQAQQRPEQELLRLLKQTVTEQIPGVPRRAEYGPEGLASFDLGEAPAGHYGIKHSGEGMVFDIDGITHSPEKFLEAMKWRGELQLTPQQYWQDLETMKRQRAKVLAARQELRKLFETTLRDPIRSVLLDISIDGVVHLGSFDAEKNGCIHPCDYGVNFDYRPGKFEVDHPIRETSKALTPKQCAEHLTAGLKIFLQPQQYEQDLEAVIKEAARDAAGKRGAGDKTQSADAEDFSNDPSIL